MRTHHLQVIAHDHVAAGALITFRDALRDDPHLRQTYASLKNGLAERHQTDRNAYSNAKTDFVRSVLQSRGITDLPRTPV
jgi:GrpB-like predicted nucleotidyltransferase (UPF0157 family)